MPLPFDRERIAVADFRLAYFHVLLAIMRGDILSLERGSQKQFMEIRPAESSDLESASQLWFDRINLLQQVDWHVQLAPNAIEEWRSMAGRWLSDEQVCFLVAVKDDTLIGMVAVEIAAGEPGLHPQRKGRLLEMAVDLHSTHGRLSEQLLDQAKRWLSANEVTQLEVDVPARYPVEAAFWRAQGAKLRFERRWLRI